MKLAMFTDIHWGARGNGLQHLQDCAEFIDFFIANVVERECDAIAFLGDWFENRNAINVSTLNASFDALKKLDALGLPIYFIIGNHDLYHRENRNQYSTHHFEQFDHVILINEPYHDQKNDLMFFPFLFRDEYPDAAALIAKHDPKYVFGHFEFRNFVITGSDRKMEHGPDHGLFNSPTYIFSGHYHKRQARDNVIYIGNTFGTNFGDAWDDARGLTILNTADEDVDFIDWPDAPKFRKVKLSDVLTDPTLNFPPKCRVRCIIDTDIGYSEAQTLREEITKVLSLREFALEENLFETKDAIHGDDEQLDDFDLGSINDAVIKMLQTGISGTASIDASKLVEIYQRL